MNKPKVIVLQEASVDGKLAVSADRPLLYGDERWEGLRGTRSFDLFKWLLRDQGVQATLEGSHSFLREGDVAEPLPPFEGDPGPLYVDFLPVEILEREGHRGWFIAVDSRGRIRWKYKDGYPGDDTWTGWYILVLGSKSTPPEYLAYLQRENIPYLITGEAKAHLETALVKLRKLLGVEVLLSTAGGTLNGVLLKAGLVDEIHIEFIPGVIGGGNAPSLFRGYRLDVGDQPVHLELLSCTSQSGGQVWLRYRVRPQEDSDPT